MICTLHSQARFWGWVIFCCFVPVTGQAYAASRLEALEPRFSGSKWMILKDDADPATGQPRSALVVVKGLSESGERRLYLRCRNGEVKASMSLPGFPPDAPCTIGYSFDGAAETTARWVGGPEGNVALAEGADQLWEGLIRSSTLTLAFSAAGHEPFKAVFPTDDLGDILYSLRAVCADRPQTRQIPAPAIRPEPASPPDEPDPPAVKRGQPGGTSEAEPGLGQGVLVADTAGEVYDPASRVRRATESRWLGTMLRGRHLGSVMVGGRRLLLSGVIAGDVVVQNGGVFDCSGRVAGDVHVRGDGKVTCNGVISGNLTLDEGSTAVVRGLVMGSLIGPGTVTMDGIRP